ncbi:zinc-dependent metalloprotease [Taibaiella chishuiensis]|uniref:Putative secreted protein (Por secretion system target) n=1 Tax=Taibaiella chishuiensis TaxID=1434707 RepID=A0A2P8CZ79_9BACT|nr:zinc-dependent metalloprotease [Taibaiella chishuiensis]PSK90274.1 putative secreted protein (Por secretion system target) [Taibaiella chishuiensis]
MKKILYLIFLLLPFPLLRVTAQESIPELPPCAFDLYWQHLEKEQPGIRTRYETALRGSGNTTGAARPTGIVYRIPVVFHVLYFQQGNTKIWDIPDSTLQEQVAILNEAYRSRNADTANLRTVFKHLKADAEIEFYLATKDPGGVTTNGITRTPTAIEAFGGSSNNIVYFIDSIERIKSTAAGGKDPWPTNRYLNIWISDMSRWVNNQYQIGVIGYGTPPLNPLPPNWGNITYLDNTRDGIILQYQFVGAQKSPYRALAESRGCGKGRTVVHEVGHYLGLNHIFGGSSNPYCSVADDDGIGDTPLQAIVTGAPDPAKNTCGAGEAGDLPDLWENYMDYTREPFQVMFTLEQAGFMRNILLQRRDTLVNDYPTGLISEKHAQQSIQVFPQPARTTLSIVFAGKADGIALTDITGKTIYQSADKQPIPVSHLPSGLYFLKLQSGQNFYTRKVVVQH